MENASKAIIIAGSVLIAVLLISLGLVVFNSTKGTTDQVDEMGEMMEVAAYNRPFEQYEGNQKGSNVKTLISNVRVHNANNSSKIKVNDEYDMDNLEILPIIVNKTYTVKMEEHDKTGKITKIEIAEES